MRSIASATRPSIAATAASTCSWLSNGGTCAGGMAGGALEVAPAGSMAGATAAPHAAVDAVTAATTAATPSERRRGRPRPGTRSRADRWERGSPVRVESATVHGPVRHR
ncbi:hypothetical protein GCM10011589_45780 [Modestobacter marinus]|uniref:Uncharacterized protein n=1 Tax=Modestobacter marinus TaxID=477641 RepID=A0ABQ2GAX0_9ACTN|nr:hypothetical protein GCM10011589_45780 [Modestobacter marinus]